jgi:uncharacterized membrane protein
VNSRNGGVGIVGVIVIVVIILVLVGVIKYSLVPAKRPRAVVLAQVKSTTCSSIGCPCCAVQRFDPH